MPPDPLALLALLDPKDQLVMMALQAPTVNKDLKVMLELLVLPVLTARMAKMVPQALFQAHKDLRDPKDLLVLQVPLAKMVKTAQLVLQEKMEKTALQVLQVCQLNISTSSIKVN